MEMGDQLVPDEARRCVLGLSDGQGDMIPPCGRLDTCFQIGELLEGIGLEAIQVRVHGLGSALDGFPVYTAAFRLFSLYAILRRQAFVGRRV
jgi:hypothetical protein